MTSCRTRTGAQYDAAFKKDGPQTVPLSTSIDFMDSLKEKLNRRLAILALLAYSAAFKSLQAGSLAAGG